MGTCLFTCLLYIAGILLPAVLCVTSEVGQDVTLVCPLAGSFPEWQGPKDWIILKNDNQAAALEHKLQYVNDKDLQITDVTTLYSGTYRCIQGSQEASIVLTVNSLSPHVEILGVKDHVIPFSDDTRVLPLRSNEPETIVCMVWNAFPEPVVTLAIPGSTTDLSDTDSVVKTEENNTKTMTYSAKNVQVVASDDDKTIECEATVAGQKTKVTETIKVVRMPKLFASQESGDHSRTRNTGIYSCDALVGWPTSTVTWKSGDSNDIPDRFTINATECKQRSTDLSYNCSSSVLAKDLTKEDNGRILTCEIFFLGMSIYTHSSTISFRFPPTMAEITGQDVIEAEEGKFLTLTCKTDSARSANETSGVTFKWYVGDEEINPTVNSNTEAPATEFHGYIPTQVVSIAAQKSWNGKKVSCQASQFYLDMPGVPYVEGSKELNVKYSPMITRPTGTMLYSYIGDTLEVECAADSNPTAALSWTHSGNAAVVKDTDPDDNMASLLVENITSTDGGQYTCTANNGIGAAGSKNIDVMVYAKPSPPSFSTKLLAEGSVEVEVITSNTAPAIPRTFYVQFKQSSSQHWLNVDQPIPDTYSGAASRVEMITLPELLPGTSYDIRVKSVDANHLSFTSASTQYTTMAEESNMKTEKQYTAAILISVFVTFGIMLIILIVVVVMLRKRQSSSF